MGVLPEIQQTLDPPTLASNAKTIPTAARLMSQPKFANGDNVYYQTTNELGLITADPEEIAGEFWYRVRLGQRIDTLEESDLASITSQEESIESLAAQGRWGQLDAVRCALAIERIRHTNRSTIYSFQNQRILFQAYQYKPLLKVLDSPDRRLLIADEVGLGKTIEAGLILTELEARNTLDSVMVVCPSRLREKWKNELNRKFDQDFEIFDRRQFEQVVRRYQERPGREKIRGIMSLQAMRMSPVRELLTSVLGTLDMVIVDEAHHARNPSTSTSGLLSDLCEIGDSVILLTATPVQLDNKDLFTLLSALRPAEFRDAWAFDRLLRSHANVHVASGLARTQDTENLPRIIEILKSIFVRGRSANSINPLAATLIEELENSPPAQRSDWIDVERRIQDLHPLGTILTRTRKRDVLENAPRRVAHAYVCDWTSEEDEAYQQLVASSGSRGWPSSRLSFGQVQRARQAASCLPAAYETHILGSTDDESTELTDILPSELDSRPDSTEIAPASRFGWEGADSKYEKFDEILRIIWDKEPEEKALVFTFFKGTARYLERRLSACGVNVLRIDGEVPSDPRQPEKDERGKRLTQFREDPDVRVMISTEVGSEGLDFQFCHHLINYDLPWNPMVVEQRIGRIDRFGQKATQIFVHNLVVSGTVEDRILQRLYDRIGLFHQSLGALEAILGDTMQSLQRDYLSGELSADAAEERVEQAANAIEQREHHLRELERRASQLFGHEEYVREELQRVRNLGQFVSQKSILALLRIYFRAIHPAVKIKNEGGDVFGIRLTDELRIEIQDAARRRGTSWSDRSDGKILRFTTSGETAFEFPRLELVNNSHPLVLSATDGLAEQMEKPAARLGAAEIEVASEDAEHFPEGVYFLTLVPQQVNGIRGRRLIEAVGIHSETERPLSQDLGQRLLFLVIEHGRDWCSDDAPSISVSTWTLLRREMLRRTSELKKKEQGENGALFARRKDAIEAEYEHERDQKQRRLETSRQRGNERIAKLFEAQVEKAGSRYRAKLEELEGGQAVSVVPGEPIAACVVRVKNKN